MARRLFLSAGHTNIINFDRGASGVKDSNGRAYIEGELAVELVELLKVQLALIGITPVVDQYKNALVETMNAFKKLVTPKDLAIEIHWNAASPAATGVEVVIPGRAGLNEATAYEIKTAKDISNIIATTIRIKDRGAKTEKDTARKTLGWMRIPCENVLIETCFISNTSDMSNYQSFKKVLAIKLAEYIKSIL